MLWTELFLVSESATDRAVPGVRSGYGQCCSVLVSELVIDRAVFGVRIGYG